MEIIMPTLGETVDEGKVIKWLKNVGDEVKEGEVLATLHYNSSDNLEDSIQKVEKAYEFSAEKVESQSVVLDTIKGF